MVRGLHYSGLTQSEMYPILLYSTGSMMDMFSNLDMHNNSHSSLPHPQEPPTQDGHQSQVPISKSSELALALMPVSWQSLNYFDLVLTRFYCRTATASPHLYTVVTTAAVPM